MKKGAKCASYILWIALLVINIMALVTRNSYAGQVCAGDFIKGGKAPKGLEGYYE